MILNSLVRSRLTYSCQTWNLNNVQTSRVSSTYMSMLRKIVKGGTKRRNSAHDTEDSSFHFIYTNDDILCICNTDDIHTFIEKQQINYLAHITRQPNQTLTKMLLFNSNKRTKQGRPIETLEDKVLKATGKSADNFYKAAMKREIGHDQHLRSDRQKLSR